jgi:hypothetical protein
MRNASVFRPRSARKLSNWSGDRADCVLQEAEPLAQLVEAGVAGRLGDHRDAADDVGVAVQVLGHRVHDDVEAELERSLHVGARERVVGRP